ncbi:hypothetical protein DFP90_107125 [Aestuariispira insulae]|uniref:Uncharacterized protein n=2 Tax=Aestuariispira insulae TaxID=1461337 RepID=A0A3D9HH84_9PROT|nr:hypothetical protein DFP90_107125 [Aestuariispira insulae]
MKTTFTLAGLFAVALPLTTLAHPIESPQGGLDADPAFDIVETRVIADKNNLVFSIKTAGIAGSLKPTATGNLAGSEVYAYVWPTSLDSSLVGFEKEQGILAFTVTAHPDFDDTPLFDENADGDKGNDGDLWHSHWVVLTPDEACGKGGLKVRDIAEGTTPKLPKTWPGLPILIDSPGWSPTLEGKEISVTVPFEEVGTGLGDQFDGVTSALRVNRNIHNPLLCVSAVFDIASGDLSLPGGISDGTH